MTVHDFVKSFYPGQIFVVTNTSIEKLNEECERVFPYVVGNIDVGVPLMKVFELRRDTDGFGETNQVAIVRKFVTGWSANPGKEFYD